MPDEVRWFDVADLSECWEGDVLDFEVSGEEVLLVLFHGGDIKAYQGLCPHQETLLADGDWDPDTNVLVCNAHKWEFDLRTGAGINPGNCELFEFPVKVKGETVQVGIPQDGQQHYNRCQGS